MVQDRGPATEAVTIVFVVLATIFVAARFFTRVYLVRSVKQDDWWILAAWVVAVGFASAICVGVSFGLGKHRDDIPPDQLPSLRKTEYAFSILYNPGLMLTKTSIIVFYLSVMSRDVDPVFKWLNWITLAIVNIAGLALTFLNIFQCSPVDAGYESPTPANAKCTDIVTLYLSSAPVNIITDIAILLLPMPTLTGMRLPRKQKIILLVTFGFGIFVAVVDIIRIAYLQSAAINRLSLDTSSQGQRRIIESNDFPWYSSLSFMWSSVEVSIGIICACVPSLKPLFARFLPSFIKDTSDVSLRGSFDTETKMGPSEGGLRGDANPLNNPAAFRTASTAEYLGDDDGDQMGFLNMLAGPPINRGSSDHSPTRLTSIISRVSTNRSTVSDFDFVTMDKSRNMLKLNNRQSLWPVAVVTVIFFLWGFAYGLLATLNGQFQTIAHLTEGQTIGLHSAYFGGYLIGPLTIGRFVLKRYGFKATMMAGLCIYGCGTLVFWPSAVLTSYPAFIVSNLIVGTGLSCLEVAANPYIALCGPLEYAEVRLNLSQAFQAVGTVVSPLLAQKVLFKNILNAPSLVDVQWTYLGIALFVFALAVAFYYIPLPEATDDQLEEQAERRSAVYGTRVGPWPVVWVTLALGLWGQWCYVGAQEGVGANAQQLMGMFEKNAVLQPFDYVTIGHTVFAVGRFISAFLNYVMKPRWILLFLFAGVSITTGLQTRVTGDAAAGVLMTTYFFEAGIFSIIYAICMRGMGVHTKTASALMTAAISGGAVIPVIQWGVSIPHGWPYSYSVLAAFFGAGALFPLYLNLVPAARNQVDPIHEKDRRLRRPSRIRQQSRISTAASDTRQFGLKGIIARKKKYHKHDQPNAQHVERSSQDHNIKTTLAKAFRSKTDDFVEIPSPAHTSPNHSKSRIGEIVSWRGVNSSSSSSGSSPGGYEANKDDNTEPSPQPRREWTEKDDMIDDYHNALKDI